MKMIVGLGNPGEKYLNTRHNTGFVILDEFALSKGLSWKSAPKLKSSVCLTDNFILVKPQTYMNESGRAVSLVKEYYKIDLEDICIVHDDVDISIGQTKLQKGAGHAGHKGVISTMEALGTKDFMRFRVGIGRPDSDCGIPVDDYVLRDFSLEELDIIKKLGAPLLENIN